MDTKILKWWAKFKKLSYLDKRKIFTQLVSEETSINCEWKIFKILTRLTFKRYKDLHKIPHPDDKHVQKLLDELSLSPSTVNNWYYSTRNKTPLELRGDSCGGCRFSSFCDGSLDKNSYNNIKDKYGYDLLSKRLYQVLIKVEKFKGLLKTKASDADIRIVLRRLVQYDYNFKNTDEYSELETDLLNALGRMKYKPITALKWFYALINSKELMQMAIANKISPDEVIRRSMLNMKHELHDPIYELGGEAI